MDLLKQPETPGYSPEPEQKFPHEVYNMIIFKCFDACILAFDNKTLDSQEQHCVDECAMNVKESPNAYQRAQQYHGFISQQEIQTIELRRQAAKRALGGGFF